MVKMTHPKLPDREIEIPESGVAHRERAGWQRAKNYGNGLSLPQSTSAKNDTGKPEQVEKPKGKSNNDEGAN